MLQQVARSLDQQQDAMLATEVRVQDKQHRGLVVYECSERHAGV